MKTQEIGKKLADLLYNNGYSGNMHFDWKTYDDKNDIPHITLYGFKRCDVLDFFISKDGFEVTITTKGFDGEYMDYTFYLNYIKEEQIGIFHDEDNYEKFLNDMGVYDLLENVYYETGKSYEIGDFEDFLNEWSVIEENKDSINDYIYNKLMCIFEMGDASMIASDILDEVIDDIKETSDADYNDDDIDLAIQRVLLKRLSL